MKVKVQSEEDQDSGEFLKYKYSVIFLTQSDKAAKDKKLAKNKVYINILQYNLFQDDDPEAKMQFSFTRSVSYLEKSTIAFGPITKVIILNLIKSSIKQKDLFLVIQYSNQLLIKSMDGRTTKLINTHGFVDSPLIFCKALTNGQEDSVLFLES